MNVERLIKLADYLYELPEDYTGFHMGVYNRLREDRRIPIEEALEEASKDVCGTVACAVGHIPAVFPKETKEALIAMDEDCVPGCDYWSELSNYVLDVDSPDGELGVWGWLFGTDWQDVDDTARGAAQRIYQLLSDDTPCYGNFDIRPAFSYGSFLNNYDIDYTNLTPSSVDELRETPYGT